MAQHKGRCLSLKNTIVNILLQTICSLFNKNLTNNVGLPLTETNGYVFCIGAVFTICVRSLEPKKVGKARVSKDAVINAAGLNEPKHG
jgi:hypothetical protein